MFCCSCVHGICSNFCHHEHLVVTAFLLSLVQEVLRGPLPVGRDKQHYTQPTLFECWNHPGVSHDHLTFLVRAFICQRTSICISFFVYIRAYIRCSILLLMQVETQHNPDIYVLSCELYCSEQMVFLFSSFCYPLLLVVWENIRTVVPVSLFCIAHALWLVLQTFEK
jgi:hypothetical protein